MIVIDEAVCKLTSASVLQLVDTDPPKKKKKKEDRGSEDCIIKSIAEWIELASYSQLDCSLFLNRLANSI
jgi:hypothetical protein